jgi:enoyl-CoA hydratase
MFIADDYKHIHFKVEEGIGLLEIRREKKLNALNSEVLKELRDIAERLIDEDKASTVKGIIFTGEGEKAFIAGADIAEMKDMDIHQAKEFGTLGQEVTLLFERLPMPIIACVNGYALGGGCEMAMACDFIYASENAVFGLPEVKLGLIPGFGGTQRLAKMIGRQRAKELVFSGRNLNAEKALAWGLANHIYDTKDCMIKAAKKMLGEIMKASPNAVKAAKKTMNIGNDLTIPQGLQCELEKFSEIFQSEDKKEGTNAFLEKRPPNFTGN